MLQFIKHIQSFQSSQLTVISQLFQASVLAKYDEQVHKKVIDEIKSFYKENFRLKNLIEDHERFVEDLFDEFEKRGSLQMFTEKEEKQSFAGCLLDNIEVFLIFRSL